MDDGQLCTAQPGNVAGHDDRLVLVAAHLVVEHPAPARTLSASPVDRGHTQLLRKGRGDEGVVTDGRSHDETDATFRQLSVRLFDRFRRPCRQTERVSVNKLYFRVQTAGGLDGSDLAFDPAGNVARHGNVIVQR